MDEESLEFTEPANIKLLRRLVTVLLITMIVGFVILISVFVSRFTGEPETPAYKSVPLPDGSTATGYSQGDGWFAITTDQNQILIFNSDNSLRQQIDIKPQ